MGRGLTKLHKGKIRVRNVFANSFQHAACTWMDAALGLQVWQCGQPKPLAAIPQKDLQMQERKLFLSKFLSEVDKKAAESFSYKRRRLGFPDVCSPNLLVT